MGRFALPRMQLRPAHGDAALLSAESYGSILAVRWSSLVGGSGPAWVDPAMEQGFSIERALFRLRPIGWVMPESGLSTAQWQGAEAHWPESGHVSCHEACGPGTVEWQGAEAHWPEPGHVSNQEACGPWMRCGHRRSGSRWRSSAASDSSSARRCPWFGRTSPRLTPTATASVRWSSPVTRRTNVQIDPRESGLVK